MLYEYTACGSGPEISSLPPPEAREFHARAERREGGVRIIETAELVGLALVAEPSYPASRIEVREGAGALAVPLWCL